LRGTSEEACIYAIYVHYLRSIKCQPFMKRRKFIACNISDKREQRREERRGRRREGKSMPFECETADHLMERVELRKKVAIILIIYSAPELAVEFIM
jgi:hypothetical protein